MINPNRSVQYDAAKRTSQLWVRLGLIFVGSFIVAFAIFFAYDLLTGFAERSMLAATVSGRPAPIVIDPKIADELRTVLAQDNTTGAFEVSDPFLDRSGLTGTPGVITTGGSSSAATGGNNASGPPSKIQTVSGANTTVAAQMSPLEATRQRYQAWLERAAANPDLALDPRVFAIEDLLPVGIVDGGTGGQEVMFMSGTAGRTVSFPVGTMFFDGWLNEVKPEGVVFSFNDGHGTLRLRSWARSLRAAS
jgi:hypothetical protein